MLSPSRHCLRIAMCSPNRKFSESPFLLFLRTLHCIGMIDEIIGHWTSSFSPFSRGQRVELKVPILYSGLVPLATSPHSYMLSKSHLNSKNLVVVKKGLLWITGHLYGSEILSKTNDRDQLVWQNMLLLLSLPRKFPGFGELWTRNRGWKKIYKFLVMWPNSYISFKSQYCTWQIDLVDVIKLKMGSLSLNILVGSVVTGPYHHRNRGWRDARKDYYRAGCLTCTEASAMALALEEATGKGTGDRTQMCVSHPGFRTKFKGKLGLRTVSLEARFPCWRTSPFKKGASGSISVCKITPGLNNQPLASRKQSQFKLVSAVSISPFFFIHSSVLREIMCRLL